MQDTPTYLTIDARTTARERLRSLRDTATNTGRNWREIRAYGYGNWRAAHIAGLFQGSNGEGRYSRPIWYSHSGPNFRKERPAHECEGGPDHTGWYTNHDGMTYKDGTGLAWGIVARLPHGRFIAGYQWGDNGERVYFPDVYDDEAEAARMADRHAESFAEEQQEDNRRFCEARELEDKIERAQVRAMECYALRNHPRYKDAGYRDEARELIENIREWREELTRDYSDYL